MPVAKSLPLFPVSFWMVSYIPLFVHKSSHVLATDFDILLKYVPRRDLRSTDSLLLAAHKTLTKPCGEAAFCSFGPSLWNSLPVHLRTAASNEVFKPPLKIHFVGCAHL